MPDINELMLRTTPTSLRPLLGLTVLVVEDSRFACEALRLMCLRSGARIRRADCLSSAERHLKVYRPSAVIVDMGLPDGDGADLIRELAEAQPRVPVIIGTSGDDGTLARAMDAGADGFLAKPVASVAAFQAAILEHLPMDQHPSGPRLVEDDEVVPDVIAYRDDMAHAADVLETRQDPATLAYLSQFLSGVARTANDGDLAKAVDALPASPSEAHLGRLAGLLKDRMEGRVAI